MKKLLIKIFGLHDIQGLLQDAREKQKAHDDKLYVCKLKDLEEKYKLELDYKEQSHGAELVVLNAELEKMRKRESQLNRLESRLKNQIKRNVSIATMAHSHIFNVANFLNKEAAEIHGLLDQVEKEQKKVTSSGRK